ncbi:Lrp/AsnC family transcriptional regulator [Hirschia maritima]|uniref:Lrp/AsnC family transcriptional regulator n=1 Tax=Hirschia maritima TaxID=1121961 RepID=UPI00037D9364|nr:Lrp/AsnC family transcriptional regulator [Hirschia maritima]
MDSIDRKIIRELQKNGRITNQELATKVNLSPSPCLRRLKALEERGIIKGYSAVIDAKSYGLPLTALIRIKLDRHSEDAVRQFEDRVRRLDEVIECHVLTGATDYFMKVLVAGLEEYEEFVRKQIHPIGDINSIDSSFVYGTVKTTNVFPDI